MSTIHGATALWQDQFLLPVSASEVKVNFHGNPRSHRSVFKQFLVPENALSLKLIFDNVTHYGITAAFIAGLLYAYAHKSVLAMFEDVPFVPIALTILALSLLILTVLQSIEIADLVNDQLQRRRQAMEKNRHSLVRIAIHVLFIVPVAVIYIVVGSVCMAGFLAAYFGAKFL